MLNGNEGFALRGVCEIHAKMQRYAEPERGLLDNMLTVEKVHMQLLNSDQRG